MTHPGCVVATIYGPPCRAGLCVWQSQADDEFMDGASRAWAAMVSRLCSTLPEGATRTLVTTLALNWDGNADELLSLVGTVLAEPGT